MLLQLLRITHRFRSFVDQEYGAWLMLLYEHRLEFGPPALFKKCLFRFCSVRRHEPS